MAERSNSSSKKPPDAAEDVGTLQKRGRRRLVGAIALVLLAVIVLPMVFDPEPRPGAPAVSVRIPSEEGTKFTPKSSSRPVAPEAVEGKREAKQPAAPTPAVTAPKAEAPKAIEKKIVEKKGVDTPEKKGVDTPVAKSPEKPAAAEPAPAGEQFMAQVGAFANPEKIKTVTDQLRGAGLPFYTESVATAQGSVTRIRLGPFPSRDAAEKAREAARALGLNAAGVVARN